MKLNEFHFLQNSNLPWIVPKKTLGLDLSNLSDALDGVLGVCFTFQTMLLIVISDIYVHISQTPKKEFASKESTQWY